MGLISRVSSRTYSYFVEMSDSSNTPNSFNFHNTPTQQNSAPNLTTQITREDQISTIQQPSVIQQYSVTHFPAEHNAEFVNSVSQNSGLQPNPEYPTVMVPNWPNISSPLSCLPSKSPKTQAVPLFRSNSIDSDKFLPASCLNQLIKDFYKSSSASSNTRKRNRKTNHKKEEDAPPIK